MTTMTEPTFETIAKSAKFITVKKTNYAPLPCEEGFEIKSDESIVKLTERLPVLNMSFIEQTYFDTELKTDMPLFAVVDVEKGIIRSSSVNTTIDWVRTQNKLNPKLKSIISPSNSAKLAFVPLGAVIGFSVPFFFVYNDPVMSGFVGLFSAVVGGVCGAYFSPLNKDGKIIDFSYQFEGQIPDDVRAIYHAEKSNFDSIHLICDAKNRWIAEERPLPPPNPDPLLVGVKKLKSGKDLVFLLAKFDLTPAEQYIADEFAI